MQRFLPNFVSVEFLVELDFTLTRCVVLCCVVFCCLSCIASCCDLSFICQSASLLA